MGCPGHWRLNPVKQLSADKFFDRAAHSRRTSRPSPGEVEKRLTNQPFARSDLRAHPFRSSTHVLHKFIQRWGMATPAFFSSFCGLALTPRPPLAMKLFQLLRLLLDCGSRLPNLKREVAECIGDLQQRHEGQSQQHDQQNATHQDVSLRWRCTFLGD